MVLEIAILNVAAGREAEFEAAFHQASKIIASMQGYVSHQLQHCIETPSQYALLVNWATLEDHTQGFRGSAQYQEWRTLLHHFYDPFPTVEHYTLITENRAS
ncbi:antibiotic biosynthesis monooxygenase [Candidatus Methylospira mobilis]|uniref:Antibiotic biosynthesis monooxygenase n=1 Tax=Candidatus Methylospira mobilis TaxID=1808979 RepID=A0A5Q0BJC1_9GAMM|nr:antibiotic biosynthesis monooxygenase [Candidatus Methylospira mobilis]QFY41906.1 antibiotic biosynthesis monooxygenase [Candidatus Methylospira mobilis]WNV06784.1 antibiotic biosynthesis monooxygenase [Candidatus Methylospira mobilis]